MDDSREENLKALEPKMQPNQAEVPARDLLNNFKLEQHTNTKLYQRFLEEEKRQKSPPPKPKPMPNKPSGRYDRDVAELALSKEMEHTVEEQSLDCSRAFINPYPEMPRQPSFPALQPSFNPYYPQMMQPSPMIPPVMQPMPMMMPYPMYYQEPHDTSHKDQEIQRLSKALESSQLDVMQLEDRLKETEDTLSLVRGELMAMRHEPKPQVDMEEIKRLKDNVGHLTSEIHYLREDKDQLEQRVNGYKNKMLSMEKELEKAENKVSDLEIALEEAHDKFTQLKRTYNQEKTNHQNEIAYLNNQLDSRKQNDTARRQLEEAYSQIEELQEALRAHERRAEQRAEFENRQQFERNPRQDFERNPRQDFERNPRQDFERNPRQDFERNPRQEFDRNPRQDFERNPRQEFDRNPRQDFDRNPRQEFDRNPRQDFDRNPRQEFDRNSRQGFERREHSANRGQEFDRIEPDRGEINKYQRGLDNRKNDDDSNKTSNQIQNLERHLMNLQMEKKRLENDLNKLPEQPRNLAAKKKKNDLELELDIVSNNVLHVKDRLRSLHAIHT